MHSFDIAAADDKAPLTIRRRFMPISVRRLTG